MYAAAIRQVAAELPAVSVSAPAQVNGAAAQRVGPRDSQRDDALGKAGSGSAHR